MKKTTHGESDADSGTRVEVDYADSAHDESDTNSGARIEVEAQARRQNMTLVLTRSSSLAFSDRTDITTWIAKISILAQPTTIVEKTFVISDSSNREAKRRVLDLAFEWAGETLK